MLRRRTHLASWRTNGSGTTGRWLLQSPGCATAVKIWPGQTRQGVGSAQSHPTVAVCTSSSGSKGASAVTFAAVRRLRKRETCGLGVG
jgi:hypothetical protein